MDIVSLIVPAMVCLTSCDTMVCDEPRVLCGGGSSWWLEGRTGPPSPSPRATEDAASVWQAISHCFARFSFSISDTMAWNMAEACLRISFSTGCSPRLALPPALLLATAPSPSWETTKEDDAAEEEEEDREEEDVNKGDDEENGEASPVLSPPPSVAAAAFDDGEAGGPRTITDLLRPDWRRGEALVAPLTSPPPTPPPPPPPAAVPVPLPRPPTPATPATAEEKLSMLLISACNSASLISCVAGLLRPCSAAAACAGLLGGARAGTESDTESDWKLNSSACSFLISLRARDSCSCT
mmetsp:Transcript_25797/g.50829  ORF Transcript_25797/g.50829 Transcript_25797/m.50829 type:complete len:297 (-) Transcript_25797:329-1219(-)